MKSNFNFKEYHVTYAIWLFFLLSILSIYISLNFLLPKDFTSEDFKKYTNIAKKITNLGLNSIEYNNVEIKTTDSNINTLPLYNDGLSSVDYSKVTMVIEFDDFSITQSGNILEFNLKGLSKLEYDIESEVIKSTYRSNFSIIIFILMSMVVSGLISFIYLLLSLIFDKNKEIEIEFIDY